MAAAIDYVFVHGGGQGGWVWGETIAAMQMQAGAGAIRALALDGPGCGDKRDRDTSAVSYDETVQDLVDDIDRACFRDIVLVGHSQAGTFMPRMAELRPELFRRLVYVTCSAPTPGVTTIDMMGDCVHGESETQVGWPVDPRSTTVADRFRAMFCNDMSDAEADAFLTRLRGDMWPRSSYAYADWRYDHLAAIPSTFVLCLQDQSLPPIWQERFAERFQAEKVVQVDAGHQVMNTRPHTLAEVLLAEARR